LEPYQYGGADLRTASLFLRRMLLSETGDASSAHVVAGMRATALLLARLPRLRVCLTGSPVGERLRDHFSHRIWGIPHARIAQGVLVLPEEKDRYLRGRSRHALRTGINKARAGGITCRGLNDVEERRVVARSMRERIAGMWEWGDDRFCLPGDSWWAAIAPDGEPVAIAQMVLDREWAVLKSFASKDRASRYLLHTSLVETLARANVRYLATDGPMAPMLGPNLQYWQHLLGYGIFNLALDRRPLAEAEVELALDVGAELEPERVLSLM
jgi:hypothetical protein